MYIVFNVQFILIVALSIAKIVLRISRAAKPNKKKKEKSVLNKLAGLPA